ncbi:MAG: hypothetical protein K0R21_1041 [Anaerocolumna sp.]|jgi:protein AbiQ|nr:hypothetical protein [Anaerocolumna sp.]
MAQKKSFITFLTSAFYNDYPLSKYPQIEQKIDRPYAQVIVTIRNLHFAIPLRSNITHPHAFWTDRKNRCGVDFSKAVVILDETKYINDSTKVFLRLHEYDKLRGKEFRITQMMSDFIETYKSARLNPADEINQKICRFSTLQYFEEYIYQSGGLAIQETATTTE